MSPFTYIQIRLRQIKITLKRPVKCEIKHALNTIFLYFSDGPNSIHKLVLDVFSNDKVTSHFYTNDLMVLIDIIAR